MKNTIKKIITNCVRAIAYFGIASVAMIVASFAGGDDPSGWAVGLSGLVMLVAPIVFAAMRSGEDKAHYLPFAGGSLAVMLALFAGPRLVGHEFKPVVLGDEPIEAAVADLRQECELLGVDCEEVVFTARQCAADEAAVICASRMTAGVADELAVARVVFEEAEAERKAAEAKAEAERKAAAEKYAAESKKRLMELHRKEAEQAYAEELDASARGALATACHQLHGFGIVACVGMTYSNPALAEQVPVAKKHLRTCSKGQLSMLESCTADYAALIYLAALSQS